jgi:hypothetical protein
MTAPCPLRDEYRRANSLLGEVVNSLGKDEAANIGRPPGLTFRYLTYDETFAAAGMSQSASRIGAIASLVACIEDWSLGRFHACQTRDITNGTGSESTAEKTTTFAA